MPATDLLSRLLKFNSRKFSYAEKLILEAKFMAIITRELEEIFKSKQQNYLKLIKSNKIMEEQMLGTNLLSELIKDILSTGEYTLSGIANNIRIPEDLLYDIASGINTNPTLELSRRLFELHATIRRDFYNDLIEKVFAEFSNGNVK